jgi:peptide/nickel transport system permease protein
MHRIPLTYIIKRFGYFIAVLWVAATINFILPRIISRDPVLDYLTELQASVGAALGVEVQQTIEAYRAWAGLNKPVWQQYVIYLNNLLRMDFGNSLTQYRPVATIISWALPWTIGLLGTTTLIAFILGTLLGALSVWPPARRLFTYAVPVLMVFSVIPPFIVALVFADIFAFRLRLFPIAGLFTPGRYLNLSDINWWLDVIYHATLPALSLIVTTAGVWSMGMRGMMITVLGEDFIRFAEERGLKRTRILIRYAIRNVMLPQTTALAVSLGTLVSSVTLVEMIYAYPGMGTLLERAVRASDYNLIQGCVFFLILAIAIATLILDLIYPLLDPRITYKPV